MSQKQMISTTYRYIYSIWKVISDILPRIKYYINRSDKIHLTIKIQASFKTHKRSSYRQRPNGRLRLKGNRQTWTDYKSVALEARSMFTLTLFIK